MSKMLLTLGLCATFATAAAIPQAADARTRHTYHHTSKVCRHSANKGTAIGAVGGGLAGAAIGHGGLGGTLIGAGAGAVAGHEIAKSNCKKKYR